VLEELATAGIPDAAITIIMALGLHRPMTEVEMEAAVGAEVYRRVRVVNHDPADCVRLGITSFGTPVEILSPLVEADVRICLGNLELHYFAGYSGGAKAVLPGCASRATINANHSLMVRPEARAGRLAANPVRADLEEGAAMLGIDFILNVVVDGVSHRIVGAVAGEVTAAHRRGCELVTERGIVEIKHTADVVLASAGGYPKDVNLYQAQKALDNAAYALRDGGVLILAAECPEGLGNATFEEWLSGASPDELLSRIQQQFVLGGHKAAAVAAVLRRAEVYLMSALPDDLVRRCGMVPFADLDSAVAAALDRLGADARAHARVLVLPQGGSILPLPANGVQ
jgi:nickel-dependent lactate racemase